MATITSGVLAVVTDVPFPLCEPTGAAGGIVGFDVELAAGIARRLSLTVEWVATNSGTVLDRLAAGTFDMVTAAVCVTPERRSL